MMLSKSNIQSLRRPFLVNMNMKCFLSTSFVSSISIDDQATGDGAQ